MNAPAAQAVIVAQQQPPSLIHRFAARFGVEPNRMLVTLKATAFRQKPGEPDVTNEQLMALLVVAEQYGLNPWTKEIYAFPDKGGIIPIVGVDGWARIINENAAFNGVEFTDAESADGAPPAWIECAIYRKDREHPTRVREYMAECKRGTGPWSSHPRRMLRHKALMQCARIAFGYVGIYDEDEAARIIDGSAQIVMPESRAVSSINAAITGEPAPVQADAQLREDPQPTTIDNESGEVVGAGAAKEAETVKPEATKPAATKPPATADRPTLPYSNVRAQLDAALAAKSKEKLDEAAASISLVVSLTQQKELNGVYKDYAAQLDA